MQWKDLDNDGLFEEKVIDPNNPTEIWTAWWVPPVEGNSALVVADSLKKFLSKCIQYHQGLRVGREALIVSANDFGEAEEAEETKNALLASGAFAGNEIKIEADFDGFKSGWRRQIWKLCHIISHGLPQGYYFEKGNFEVSDYLGQDQTACGANIVTASSCYAGNILGEIESGKADFPNSLALQMVFHPQSPTVAVCASAQEVLASFNTQPFLCQILCQGMHARYLGYGLFQVTNSNFECGLPYSYRTVHEQTLVGDPFANLR